MSERDTYPAGVPCWVTNLQHDVPMATAFYEELFACEARHYRTFVDLATSVKADADAVRARLEEIARAEGRLVEVLGKEPTVHG